MKREGAKEEDSPPSSINSLEGKRKEEKSGKMSSLKAAAEKRTGVEWPLFPSSSVSVDSTSRSMPSLRIPMDEGLQVDVEECRETHEGIEHRANGEDSSLLGAERKIFLIGTCLISMSSSCFLWILPSMSTSASIEPLLAITFTSALLVSLLNPLENRLKPVLTSIAAVLFLALQFFPGSSLPNHLILGALTLATAETWQLTRLMTSEPGSKDKMVTRFSLCRNCASLLLLGMITSLSLWAGDAHNDTGNESHGTAERTRNTSDASGSAKSLAPGERNVAEAAPLSLLSPSSSSPSSPLLGNCAWHTFLATLMIMAGCAGLLELVRIGCSPKKSCEVKGPRGQSPGFYWLEALSFYVRDPNWFAWNMIGFSGFNQALMTLLFLKVRPDYFLFESTKENMF